MFVVRCIHRNIICISSRLLDISSWSSLRGPILMAKHGKFQKASRPFRNVSSAERSIPAKPRKGPACSSSMQTTMAVSTSLRRENTGDTLNGGLCMPLWALFVRSPQTVEMNTCHNYYWQIHLFEESFIYESCLFFTGCHTNLKCF